MNRFLGKRALTGFFAGLCLVGCLASGALVSPLAKGYLTDQPDAGETIIPTNAPLIRVYFTPHKSRLMVRKLCAAMACSSEPERI
jgi:hypothetical protein